MKNEMIGIANVILVYLNDDFVGYVKDYRIYRNKKYRFNKTRNINKAIKFIFKNKCEKQLNRVTKNIEKYDHIN